MVKRLAWLTLFYSCSLVMTGCGSTKVTTLVKLEPLGKKAPVEVILHNEPTYNYEVVCKAEVHRFGSFVGTSRSDYKKEAKSVARGCGAKIAIIESISGYSSSDGSANVTVEIIAIRKTSDPSRFSQNPGLGGRLGTAAATDNAEAVGKILSRISLSVLESKRAPADSKLLSDMMLIIAGKGARCPAKTIQLLYDRYGVRITGVKEKESATKNHTAGLLRCPVQVLEASFDGFRGKNKIVEDITMGVREAITRTSDPEDLKVLLTNYKAVHPKVMAVIDGACSRDDTSQACLIKPLALEVEEHLPQ